MNLLPEDRLQVEVAQMGSFSFSAESLTLQIDTETDMVAGIALPNANISVESQHPDGTSMTLSGTTDGEGDYSVSFAGTQDLVAGSWVQVSVEGSQGETYRISRFLPSRLAVGAEQAYLRTSGAVPARLTVRDAAGTIRETIEGITNRIGDVCQRIIGLVQGDLIRAEVDGTVTEARLPTIDVNLGSNLVTGVADPNAEVTCAANHYLSTATSSNGEGAFTCDFTDIHTLARGDLIQVTAQKGIASATSQTYVPYVPVGLHVSSSGLTAYTEPYASVTVTIRDEEGVIRETNVGEANSWGVSAVEATGLWQIPWIDDNGNAVPNEAEDGEIAQSRGLANLSLSGEPPTINNILPPTTILNGEGLIRSQIHDDSHIANVWTVVYPPSFSEPEPVKDGTTPELNLPQVQLSDSDGDGEYVGVYENFSELGTYRLVVYAKDAEGNLSLPMAIEMDITSTSSGQALFLPLIVR